jgi:hypothetical protein
VKRPRFQSSPVVAYAAINQSVSDNDGDQSAPATKKRMRHSGHDHIEQHNQKERTYDASKGFLLPEIRRSAPPKSSSKIRLKLNPPLVVVDKSITDIKEQCKVGD